MVPELRGITCSVNYGPLLALTLPANMHHLAECWVVTSPDDELTQELACSVPGVRLHVTDAWTRHQARMNKGLALEEGFSVMGRHGQMLIWDADIIFPDSMPLDDLQPDRLYGARRRILADPAQWHPGLDWRTCPFSRDGTTIGFFQAFHTDDPAIREKRPWYDVSFAHAGGSDAYFLEHWHPSKRTILAIDTLHLGVPDMNWFGVDQAGRDMMARYVHDNGWKGASRKHSAESAARAEPVVDRVVVPGYEPSGYEQPFVRRARQFKGR